MKKYIIVFKSNDAMFVLLPHGYNIANEFSPSFRCIIDVQDDKITFDGAHWKDIENDAL